jgi:hypothetical protein
VGGEVRLVRNSSTDLHRSTNFGAILLVLKYLPGRSKPPSQTWRTFLHNHLRDLVSADFFQVPTVFFHLLFVFVVLAHERRRMLSVASGRNQGDETSGWMVWARALKRLGGRWFYEKPPTISLVFVAGTRWPELLIEVDAVAVVPAGSGTEP